MKKMKFQQFAQILSDIWRFNMNKTLINSRKAYFILGLTLSLLVIAFAFSIMYGQVQAAPGEAMSMDSANIRTGYCSANRSLVHRAILRRLDFTLSDGRGNALGLRDEVTTGWNPGRTGNLQHLDFALSDGKGNALGLRDGVTTNETAGRTGTLQYLDFALSDGRGNALGLRDDNFSLASSVLAGICQ